MHQYLNLLFLCFLNVFCIFTSRYTLIVNDRRTTRCGGRLMLFTLNFECFLLLSTSVVHVSYINLNIFVTLYAECINKKKRESSLLKNSIKVCYTHFLSTNMHKRDLSFSITCIFVCHVSWSPAASLLYVRNISNFSFDDPFGRRKWPNFVCFWPT